MAQAQNNAIVVEIINELFMNDQYCALSTDIGVQVGEQVRVCYEQESALYTVKWLFVGESLVRLNGKVRLGISAQEANGTVQGPFVVSLGLSDIDAKRTSYFIEKAFDNVLYNDFICIAPHGGDIDLKTDFQAESVHARISGSSLWMCKGYKKGGGAFTAWHVTSNDISPGSYPELKKIVSTGRKFTQCVAFHGMATGGVLIGGLAPIEVKQSLQKAILTRIDDPGISVRIATPRDECNGMSKRNIVNWLTKDGASGVQIEQDTLVRKKYWMSICDAVVEIFGNQDSDEALPLL